jgi:hypothetical protein
MRGKEMDGQGACPEAAGPTGAQTRASVGCRACDGSGPPAAILSPVGVDGRAIPARGDGTARTGAGPGPDQFIPTSTGSPLSSASKAAQITPYTSRRLLMLIFRRMRSVCRRTVCSLR